MDLTKSYPNIFIYETLNKYIKNNINSECYKNIQLVYNNYNNYQYNQTNQQNEHNQQNKYNEAIEYDKSNEYESNESNKSDEPNESNELDAWESAINDDKFYINNKIARIFPVLKNFDNFSKIKIDDDSFCYITIREIADTITKIICYHLLEHNLNPQKCIISDYTAGVGGNVLSFAKFFKYVYAIEIDELRAEYLDNNIDIYGFKNIEIINECAIEFNNNKLIETNPNIIFIDPPWGGSGYKNNDNLILSIGKINLEELVINIVSQFSNHYNQIINSNPKEKYNNYNNKFIILKLPKNYDVEYFYNYVKTRNNFKNYNICMYLYILNKMIVIVCEIKYKYY